MLEKLPGTQPVTVGGDKGFDTHGFVAECRNLRVMPHVAQNLERRGGSASDGRTTRHAGYALSQRKRKRVEQTCGRMKTVEPLGKHHHHGAPQVNWIITYHAPAYNLNPLPKHLAIPARWPTAETHRDS